MALLFKEVVGQPVKITSGAVAKCAVLVTAEAKLKHLRSTARARVVKINRIPSFMYIDNKIDNLHSVS